MSYRRESGSAESPRHTYRTFPRCTSRFWTWLTGVPDDGQSPLLILSPRAYSMLALGTYFLGVCVGVSSFKLNGVAFGATLLAGWVMTVNGARRMISTVAHQCVHAAFSGDRRIDMVVAEVFAVMTLTQTAIDYRREHFDLHHRHDVFSTIDDPSASLLWEAGFHSGTSTKRLWLQLLTTTISVRFHGAFFLRRISSQMRGRMTWHRLGAALAMLMLFTGLLWECSGHAVILGAVFPLVVLYQNSVLLEFISEHAWFVEPGRLGQKKYIHATHSWGRFCGRCVPARQGKSAICYGVDWMGWFMEHVAYHLPVRLLILPGDLSQHDFHHRKPATPRWTTATYARKEDMHTCDRRWPSYTEFWGLHHAINHVFQGIESSMMERGRID